MKTKLRAMSASSWTTMKKTRSSSAASAMSQCTKRAMGVSLNAASWRRRQRRSGTVGAAGPW